MNDSYPVYKVEFRSRDILFTSGSLNKKASRQTKLFSGKYSAN